MIGPGKYDALCTLVRRKAKAQAAIVIVIEGSKGSGFSVQAEFTDLALMLRLPEILESMAADIRAKGPGA